MGLLKIAAGLGLLMLLAGGQAVAEAPVHRLSKAENKSWREAMVFRHSPGPGCFTATYPKQEWVRTTCGAPGPRDRAPQVPSAYIPSDNMVQATGSVSTTSGSITTATGSIFDVFGLTNETVTGASPNAGTANVYSLQMNTNSFATSLCRTSSNTACNGFEQFVFVNNDLISNVRTSYVFIEFVLQNYGSTCPTAAWSPGNAGACYLPSAHGNLPVVLPLSGISGLTLTGGKIGGNDTVVVELDDGRMYRSASVGSPINLATWTQVQFNVFGDQTLFGAPPPGANAMFNPGASMQVTTTLAAQAGLSGTCYQNSVTAETANLAGASACNTSAGANPGIQFVQGVPPANVALSPAAGVATGGETIAITGIGFTSKMTAGFGTATVVPACDSLTHCTLTVPPGTGTVTVAIANVSPRTGVVGVYSTPVEFTYGPSPPVCGFSPSCPVSDNNPPVYTYSCTAPSDFYQWSGTPVNATTPPPGGLHLLASDTTDNSGSMTDYSIFVAACVPGTTNACSSHSIYVPVANYCKGSGSGGSGSGGTPPTCKQCLESGRQCQIVNGRPKCVGVVQ